jgi:hypothetical protein
MIELKDDKTTDEHRVWIDPDYIEAISIETFISSESPTGPIYSLTIKMKMHSYFLNFKNKEDRDKELDFISCYVDI